MKFNNLTNIKYLKAVSLAVTIAMLYGCSSVPIKNAVSGGTSKISPLTPELRKLLHDDFDGLFYMWIAPQLVNGEIGVVNVADQFASEKTISDNFATFCSEIDGGKSEVHPLKYGHKNICNSALGEYLGEFVTERYDSGLKVTFDSQHQKDRNKIWQQAEIEAKNKKEYQSLSSDMLSIEQLQNLIERFKNNDPERLVPHAQARLAVLIDNTNKKNEMEREARRRMLENKHIGDQVCHFDTTAEMNQSTGIRILGREQYEKVSGVNKIIGFVENINGMKIQIRISGIIFKSYMGGERNVDSYTNYKGGSEIRVNHIIWDSLYDWEGC
jgi:hypothetical protein